jgi:short-subunit dehydrogenase
MKTNPSLNGKTALVTGATGGLGAAFARRLAARGADLVLTDLHGDRLAELASEIQGRHGRQVTAVPLDLAAPGATAALLDRTEGAGVAVEVLVNNAGFATLGAFLDTPWERQAEMAAVNSLVPADLAWRFGRAMRARGSGFILNVASFASFTPIPNMAVYAASKAFARSFSEGLSFELEPAGIRVCALCPGAVATPFWDVASRTASAPVKPPGASPEQVAASALDALFAGRRLCLPRAKDHANAFFLRLLPRGFVARMAGREMGLGRRSAS